MAQEALVIGGSGLLGGALARELLAARWRVANLSRGQKPSPGGVVEQLTADRSKPGELTTALRGRSFDLVVDCAAYRRNDAIEAVDALYGRIGHYVFISTDFVYAADPGARYPLREEAAKTTANSYSAGKLECEQVLAEAHADRRFPATTLRPPHILGAGRPAGSDPLSMRDADLAGKIRRGEAVRMLAEGQLLIQPVWNRQIGVCVRHIAGNSATFGGTFNCTGGDCVTTLRYYQMVAEWVGAPLRAEFVTLDRFLAENPHQAHIARHRCYDMDRLRDATEYIPTMRLEEALAETLAAIG